MKKVSEKIGAGWELEGAVAFCRYCPQHTTVAALPASAAVFRSLACIKKNVEFAIKIQFLSCL